MRGDDSQGFNLISNDSTNKVHQSADSLGYGKWQHTGSWGVQMKDIEVLIVLVVRLHSNLKTFQGKGEKEEKRSGAR